MGQEHTQEKRSFTPKQELFIHWYVKLLNGTQAAKRAGYSGDAVTLDAMARETLGNPRVKAEIDRRIKESIVPADVLLSRITSAAMADVSPYVDEAAGTIDLEGLRQAGLGHLVTGIENTSNGPKITLLGPQADRKMLARYHKVLGSDVTIEQTVTADESVLSSLADQIAALAQGAETDTENETE